jgi:predicted ribonuclease YlaK
MSDTNKTTIIDDILLPSSQSSLLTSDFTGLALLGRNSLLPSDLLTDMTASYGTVKRSVVPEGECGVEVSPSKRRAVVNEIEVTISEEQRKIITHEALPGTVLRVTAGAGTGKTTTLLHKARHLGDKKIIYLTFNKQSAVEAQSKFTLPHVNARTIHSQAFLCRNVNNEETKILDEKDLEHVIRERLDQEIETFLTPRARIPLKEDKKGLKRAYHQIVVFIRKNLESFLQSTSQTMSRDNLYYPAKKYHLRKDEYAKVGRVPAMVSRDLEAVKQFYFKANHKLWTILTSKTAIPRVCTYDSVLKEAQMENDYIDCEVLLVDESQDLNACQLAWLIAQAASHSTHVCLVGDAAQGSETFFSPSS